MEELIANLKEDYDLLMKDRTPTDEEKKIASDIARVISAFTTELNQKLINLKNEYIVNEQNMKIKKNLL